MTRGGRSRWRWGGTILAAAAALALAVNLLANLPAPASSPDNVNSQNDGSGETGSSTSGLVKLTAAPTSSPSPSPSPAASPTASQPPEPAADPTEGWLNVPYLSQLPELPTGCEATAIAMLLQYAGLDWSKLDVADALPVSGDPNRGFYGDPHSWNGGVIYPAALLGFFQ
ncbi:MAG: C39 family peptidase, partial [Propionibacteriaceae bacterium]|nr:C39 family peptidase [Propionibacteriaceae bacterium]